MLGSGSGFSLAVRQWSAQSPVSSFEETTNQAFLGHSTDCKIGARGSHLSSRATFGSIVMSSCTTSKHQAGTRCSPVLASFRGC